MRHGIDRGLTSRHCRRKHTPCRLPFTRGSPTPPHVLFFDCMVVCESKPSLWQWKEEEYSRCHVTQTFPIHPHRNIGPLGALGRGIPCSFLCQVLTGLRLRSVPKPLAYGSRVFLCVCIHVWVCVLVKFVFEPAVLGMPGANTGREWRKSARIERGKGERGVYTEADICCGIPEIRLRSVFGTQLFGIWLILPLHLSPSVSAHFAL